MLSNQQYSSKFYLNYTIVLSNYISFVFIYKTIGDFVNV